MKSLLYILFITIGFVAKEMTTYPQKATIILNVDDFICSEQQWVYLRGYKCWISGNEAMIFDSALIEKGQHTIKLEASIPQAMCMSILFSKKGPAKFDLGVEPDSCVIFEINETEGHQSNFNTKAVQGKLHNLLYSITQERNIYTKDLKTLSKLENQEQIRDLKTKWFKKLTDLISSTEYPCVAYELAMCLKSDFPERKEDVASILNTVSNKFPQYISLQELARKRKGLPSSPTAINAAKKIQTLIQQRMHVPPLNTSLGEKINLSFWNIEGHKMPFPQNGRYILIDFWASWCKPCREQMSTIKSIVGKNKALEIYAVSIDSDHQAWEKAIKEDSTQIFQHVIATYPNGGRSYLLQQLNIKQIPANILVDQENRIIAKNLSEEQLIQKLNSIR